jgi:4-amino-4-deoxy-L-arabinose transferase-like glycosyltransferase
MATGHSLEHPAANAQRELGDFVEPEGAVPATEFRRYVQHESPPASPARVIRAVLMSDTSPPLYYLLLGGWTLIVGTSDIALRLFSVTFFIASLPLMFALSRRIAGTRAAIASCVLFAFCPLVVYYSTEGRMYSLFVFFALATALVSLLLQERGPRVGYCLLWIALSAAGFLTHYFFVFPWLAIAAFLFLQPGKFERRWLIGCGLLTGLLVMPWMWVAGGMFSSWKVTQGWLNWRPDGFHRTRAFIGQFTEFLFPRGNGLWQTPRWSKMLSLVSLGFVVLLALWRFRVRLFSGRRLLPCLWLIAACAGPTVVDLLQHTYTAAVPRYAFAGVPAACLVMGTILSLIGDKVAVASLLLVVIAWVPGLRNIYRQQSRSGEPMREIARGISPSANGSDVVLIHSIPSGVIGLARYVQASVPLASWVEQLGNHRVPESLQRLVQGHSRIILVKLHEVGASAPEEKWLRANAAVVNQQQIQTADVINFDLTMASVSSNERNGDSANNSLIPSDHL